MLLGLDCYCTAEFLATEKKCGVEERGGEGFAESLDCCAGKGDDLVIMPPQNLQCSLGCFDRGS